MSMRIAAVIAMAQNRVIGNGNSLPWYIPEDLQFFKKTTMGGVMIMGRKTYDSIGKPLPGRTSFVISRTMKDLPGAGSPVFQDSGAAAVDVSAALREGPFVFDNLEEAIEEACGLAESHGQNEIFIIGGGEIFKACLPFTDRIYLTVIHQDYEGDAFFPKLKPGEWLESARTEFDGPPPYSRVILDRQSG